MINYLKDFHRRYHSYYNLLFFSAGFILDIITLGRIDDTFNLLTFSIYFTISFIILIGYLLEWKWDEILPRKLQRASPYVDELFHFCQGALLSAFSIFYFKSASGMMPFIFFILIMGLLILNEVQHFKKIGPIIKCLLFHLNFLSFIIATIPLITNEMGYLTFILSIIVFLILIFAKFYIINRIKPAHKKTLRSAYLNPGIIMSVLFLLFYIFKIIPPIPLSLQYAGIFHKVEKIENDYHLYHEKPWYRFWHNGDQLFNAKENDSIYIFIRIFAPRRFKDQVYLYFEKKADSQWLQSDRILITIKGGRDAGFRGFAYKRNYTYGDWRALVKTQNGLEIGRISFTINDSNTEAVQIFKTIKM